MMSDEREREIDLVTARADLPEGVWEKVYKIVEEEKIFHSKAAKLLLFLRTLRSGDFQGLLSIQKAELFENFLELLRYRKAKRISDICHLVFAGTKPAQDKEYGLPQEMMTALVKTAQGETVEKVRGMIWRFLLDREVELVKTVRPDEFVFGLWSLNPLTRNTFIRFLLKNFGIDEVLEAIVREAAKRGKPIPVTAFNRFVEMAGKGEGLRHKRTLLFQILENSDLSEEESNRIWSRYLLSLSRFDLVRICREEGGIKDLKVGGPQQAFHFELVPHLSRSGKYFQWRANAIKEIIKHP